VECVETMARIARYTEEHLGYRAPARLTCKGSETARSLARAASAVADELGCRLIVAFTESGTTAHLVSSYQPRAIIAAITPDAATYRRLALWWGVVPLFTAESATTDAMITSGERLLRECHLVSPGETIVMLSGQSRTAGATNTLHIAAL
jgi:pyruvate kinase